MTKDQSTASDYSAADVQVYSAAEIIRKRPGMYIGETGARGLYHLVCEVINNSIEEILEGLCHTIQVDLRAGGAIRFNDDGRGIPVQTHPKMGRSMLELRMTVANAGMHGLGLQVVNALSERCEAEVCWAGRRYVQRYERGEPITGVEERGSTRRTGKRITFLPDPQIFGNATVDFPTLAARLRELAFLCKGLKIRLTSHRAVEPRRTLFDYPEGLADFVRYLNRDRSEVHPHVFTCQLAEDGQAVAVALQWTTGTDETIQGYGNCQFTSNGGTHVSGLRRGLTQGLRTFLVEQGLWPTRSDTLILEDLREGITAVVAIKHQQPYFEGFTRARLSNPEIDTFVSEVVSRHLLDFLRQHPRDARAIADRVLAARKERLANRRKRKR